MSDVTSSMLKICWSHLSFPQCSLVGIDGDVLSLVVEEGHQLLLKREWFNCKGSLHLEINSTSALLTFESIAHEIEMEDLCPCLPVPFVKLWQPRNVVVPSWWISDKDD
jgi:hypothetical protein